MAFLVGVVREKEWSILQTQAWRLYGLDMDMYGRINKKGEEAIL